MQVVLKSDLFGDRTVNVNAPTKMNSSATTTEGNSVVVMSRNPNGFVVEMKRRSGSTKEIFKKRPEALKRAANFLYPV